MPPLTSQERNTALNVLKLAENATYAEIKKAYKDLALQTHPDKALPENRDAATKAFQALKAAYDTLKADAPPSPEWIEQSRALNEEKDRKAAEWLAQIKPTLEKQMGDFEQHKENFDLKPYPRELEDKFNSMSGAALSESENELGGGRRFLFTYPKYDPNDAEIINKKPGYAAVDLSGTEPCVRFDPDDKASLVAALVAFKNTIGQDRDDVKIDRATLYADGEEKGKEREANLKEAIKEVNKMDKTGKKLELNLTEGTSPAQANGRAITAAGETPTAAGPTSVSTPEPRPA